MDAEKREIIWRVSHEVLCTYLKLFREEGWKITSFKSWDMIKWNAVGDRVFISANALERFFSNPTLKKSTKAVVYDSQNGPKNSRCFVAEHMFPTRALQDFTFTQFQDRNPTYREFETIFRSLNCLCYVWFEEDVALQTSGLKSNLQSGVDAFGYGPFYSENMSDEETKKGLRKLLLRRYANCSPSIRAIETSYSDGHKLFQYLDQSRAAEIPLSEVLMEISV